MKKYVAAAAGLFALLPMALSAQTNGWSLALNPRFGYFVADKPLGALTVDGPNIEMPPAATTGLALEIGTPLKFLSIRTIAETTIFAGLARRSQDGSVSCGANCERTEYRSDPLPNVGSILNLAVGLRVAPSPESWPVRPYAVGGVGLKRYDLGRGQYGEDPRYSFGGRSAGKALNAGVGFDLRLGQAVFNLEAVNYMSGPSGWRNPQTTRLSDKAFQTLHHDLFISAGMRVDVFGRH